LQAEGKAVVDTLPERLDPYYVLDEPDGKLTLYEGAMRAESDDDAIEGEGEVRFEWQPAPTFHVAFGAEAGGIPAFLDPDASIARRRFIPLDMPADSIPAPRPATANWEAWRKGFGYSTETTISGPEYSFGRDSRLARVRFNVINLGSHSGSEWVASDHGRHRARLTLENDEWRVTIDKWPDDGRSVSTLRRRGGFAFTHVLEIERADGSTFSAAHSETVQDTLFHLLSFASGSTVGLAVPSGEDDTGRVVWTRWRTTHVEPWRTRISWCDPENADCLRELFAPLYRRMSDQFWEPVMRRAIRIYVAANRPDPLDLAPVQSQIGLELLAWAVLAETEGWIVPSDRLDAHSRLRLLLKWAGIPTEPRPELSALSAFAKAEGIDGPEVITRVRNSVVHAPRRRAEWPDSSLLVDAWKLSQWYLELSILRLLDYAGDYGSRLGEGRWSGDLTPVPWKA
jgi:hypothetical protein